MKNRPGSLLIVRKMLRLGVAHGQQKLYPSFVTFFKPNCIKYDPIDIPFGDAVFVMSYTKCILQGYKLTVLWNNKQLETKIDNLQANKWFATPNVWKRYGFDIKYKNYIEDGTMYNLYVSRRLFDRCVGLKVPKP